MNMRDNDIRIGSRSNNKKDQDESRKREENNTIDEMVRSRS